MRNGYIALAWLMLIATAYGQTDSTLYTSHAETEPLHAYDILSTHTGGMTSAILPEHGKDELEYDELITKLDTTQTQCGRWGLEYILQPHDNPHDIHIMQESIRTLVENPEIRTALQKQLATIRESEAYLVSYFEEVGELSEQLGSDLYYTTLQSYMPFLNYSPRALALSVHFGPSLNIAGGISLTLLPHWVSNAQSYGNRLTFTLAENDWKWTDLIPTSQETREAFKKGSNAYLQSRYPGLNTLHDPERYATVERHIAEYHATGNTENMLTAMGIYSGSDIGIHPSAGDEYAFSYMVTGYHAWGALAFLFRYTWDCYCGMSVFNGYRTLSQRYATLDHIYTACSHVARIINAAREIDTILQEHLPQDLMQELPSSAFITGEEHHTPYIQQMNALLSSHTFNKQSRQRRAPHLRRHPQKYATGKVLTTHQLLLDNADACVPLMQYIGSVDAITNIADMYANCLDHEARFCFADINTQRTTPYIQLDGFWTPLLSADHAVCNDITLDANSAILSGPNGIGKSTAMKGIAHNIILSHSIGLATAHDAHFSLFSNIDTYLNIKENTQEGLSSFMAEKKRIDELYAATPRQSGNTLYIIDEPFRGTFAQEAERRVFEFGEFIDQYPHVMMVMATHFARPTTLEQEHRFKNYHIGITEHTDNTYQLTYRLKPGVLDWWFNDDAKRAQFIDQLSDRI